MSAIRPRGQIADGLWSRRTHLVVGEEVLVAALEDVELGVVQLGVLVERAVALPHEAAHAGPPLRGELAVEHHQHAALRGEGRQGHAQQEFLHLLLLVEVQRPLEEGRRRRRRRLGKSARNVPGVPNLTPQKKKKKKKKKKPVEVDVFFFFFLNTDRQGS